MNPLHESKYDSTGVLHPFRTAVHGLLRDAPDASLVSRHFGGEGHMGRG